MKKKFISVGLVTILALVTCLSFASPVVAEDVGLGIGVYDEVLDLENKDASWAIKSGDGIGGILGYNLSGSTFDYGVYATGLSDGDYALIYYADTEDRFNDWGGDNPGAVIDTGASSGGVLSMSGNIELGMDLPCPPDANAYYYDYTQDPDNYDNAHGAKVWLVPTSALTGGTALPVSTWPQTDDWLFETDLITYDDTDVVSEVVAISISPSDVDFGVVAPGGTADGGDITVTNAGNVSVDVSASTSPSPGIFDYVKLDGGAVSAYGETLAVGDDDVIAVTLPVPGWYVPVGPESGTLVFVAVASTP